MSAVPFAFRGPFPRPSPLTAPHRPLPLPTGELLPPDTDTEMEQLFNTEFNSKLNEEEMKAMLSEFATDYNQTHFVRDPSFKEAADKVSGATRNIFIEFLERSCTAEFSGFLLYKELGRRLKVGGRYAALRRAARSAPPRPRADRVAWSPGGGL